jgi:hypothetical protein
MLALNLKVNCFTEMLYSSRAVGDISKIGFEIFYKLEKEINGKKILVASAKTGMVCYDYSVKKIAAIPTLAVGKLRS